MLELDIKIEANDLYDYMLRHSYNSSAGIVGSCAGALLVVLFFMTGQFLYLIFGIVILVYLPWTLFIRSRRQILTNPGFQQPLHYKLDDEGITISQGDDCMTFAWDSMVKAVSTGRSIIVYTTPVNGTIFPRRQLGDQQTAVISYIASHMSPKKVRIKC